MVKSDISILMKIAIFNPKSDFTQAQQETLSKLGEVVYIEPPMEHPLEELKKLAEGAEILAVDPDNFGGFETAKERLTELMETLPNLKGLAVDTTSFGWADLEYCKKRNITVSHCPGWSKESVAEHALALLISLAKNIIKLDRKTQKGEYKLEKGFELKGKTLGIIGVGSIGSTVAQLANGIGMKVIGYNHSPKTVDDVEMKETLDQLLGESDAISINVTHKDENKHMIGKEQLDKMKDGVIIVNLADREAVDEAAMAEAMKSSKVFGYAYEGENLDETPLKDIDNAIGLKGFGWYTTEALQNLFQVWVDNIIALAENKPQNVIK